MHVTSGGALKEVTSSHNETVHAFVYPADEIKKRGLQPVKVWVAAQAGESSVGLELTLEDNSGRVLAGPATTFGTTVPQLMAITPLRASAFPLRTVPTVLILRARNRKDGGGTSLVGGLSIELQAPSSSSTE